MTTARALKAPVSPRLTETWTTPPTAICGRFLGAWLTSVIPSVNLKRAFGGFLMLVGLKLLLGK